MCTTEKAKMNLQDHLSTPISLPSTGDMFSEPVGQLDPESTLIDQVRHDCGALMDSSTLMMTKMGTCSFLKARQKAIQVGTLQWNNINYDAHI